MTVCFCVHLFSRFVVTYVESLPIFATTFVQLPFSLKVNDFTKNPVWVTWNGLVHLINLYCNIVIAFETSLFFSAKLHLLIIFSLMIHYLFRIYSFSCARLWCFVGACLGLQFCLSSLGIILFYRYVHIGWFVGFSLIV